MYVPAPGQSTLQPRSQGLTMETRLRQSTDCTRLTFDIGIKSISLVTNESSSLLMGTGHHYNSVFETSLRK